MACKKTLLILPIIPPTATATAFAPTNIATTTDIATTTGDNIMLVVLLVEITQAGEGGVGACVGELVAHMSLLTLTRARFDSTRHPS